MMVLYQSGWVQRLEVVHRLVPHLGGRHAAAGVGPGLPLQVVGDRLEEAVALAWPLAPALPQGWGAGLQPGSPLGRSCGETGS